jgi:recombinational DNA repair protein (RecF pathway)
VYTLFTKDFGLVRARASSVRREGSRMRYALQVGARISVGLVRGAHGWRAAGGSALAPLDSPDAHRVFSRIAKLVERLIAGEEKNEYLFSALSEAHAALLHAAPGARGAVELICVARILYALGYLSEKAVSSALFAHTFYGESELAEAEKERERILESVNKAIAATQM